MSENLMVKVDFSKREGIPLFKKFVLFNSGIAPIENCKRDMYTLDGVYVESLRADLFFGNHEHPMGKTVTGTEDNIKYDFSVLDEWMKILKENDITPYMSWCYMPDPVQVDNDWRKGPKNIDVWQKIYKEYSEHCKEIGINVYHEIYNEPDMDDVFFAGSWKEYLDMYRYGAKGVLEGNADAVIGGPSTAIIEKQEELNDFLKMVDDENLPLDFFSFHSYPQDGKHTETGYIWRSKMASEALAKYKKFDTTELHMNELNLIPVPWDVGGPLDSVLTAMLMLQSFNDLLELTDLTLVHWAQWLSSTVDGLGMVEDDGKIKTSMHAYRMYSQMPLARNKAESADSLGVMASSDENFACVLIWNKEDEEKSFALENENIPFEKGDIEVYKLDDELYPYPKHSEFNIKPTIKLDNTDFKDNNLSLNIGRYGIAFLKIKNSKSRINEYLPNADIIRKYHYYSDRSSNSYAEFHKPDWSVWLGMGNKADSRALVGIGLENCADEYKCIISLSDNIAKSTEAYLGVRIDYRVENEYIKSVEYNIFENENIKTNIPWGGKNTSDKTNIVEEESFVVNIKKDAPENWNGEVILSFDMQNAGVGSEAIIKLRENN